MREAQGLQNGERNREVFWKGWTIFVVITMKKILVKPLWDIPFQFTSLISCFSASRFSWGLRQGAGFTPRWADSAGRSPTKQSRNKNHSQSLDGIVCRIIGKRTKRLDARKEHGNPCAPSKCACCQNAAVLGLHRYEERGRGSGFRENMKVNVMIWNL